MSRRATRLLLLPVLVLAVALPACDVTEPNLDDFRIILQIDDVPVDLGAGVSAPVRPDRPTAVTEEVRTDFDVEVVNELESISLRPEMFDFAPGAFARTATGATAASGTVSGFLFIGGYPVPGIPIVVTVADDRVTDVTPRRIASASSAVDAAAINAFLASLPASERPALADWEPLSAQEIIAEIRGALEEPTITITIGYVTQSADGSAPLVGTLTLDEIDVSGTITR